ncbi:hypothetical protein DERP_009986 [Dermatophagoides pteronyssinus]|uniref:Uncharacterized protein n=2 Tax=Dermatophagoides pteronyssinus TaxID=6956 RepID=A0ABQ8J288_DERPT|nr:serine-threonine kinase receptor-associated protein-like [Dermatophagoides pteronyssinus]KAH9416622.1 hypothetical protein DERP_009986 [Dermatophagoides pteronyssinus]
MDIFSLNSNNNVASLKQVPLTCNGHTRPIVYLHFSSITENGFYLISASKDGKPMLRKGDTGDWIGTFEGHKGAVWGVVLNSDASLAATGSADFTAKIWNTTQGDEVFSLPHKHIVKSVDFSSDDNQLLTSSNDKIIRLFDLNNINSDPQNFIGHDDNIRQALFSNIEGTQFVSCADDKTIRFWDKRSTKECFKLTFDQKPNGIEVTNDKSILSICYDQNVIFFDLSRMVQIKKFQAPTVIETSSLHPDKNVFVCGGLDFLIYKCDYNRCETIDSYSGHFGAVHCLRYSPDGELYASGSEDGTLRLWQNTIGKTYGLWKYVDSNETE